MINTQAEVFLVVTPYNFMLLNQGFGGLGCLQFQGEDRGSLVLRNFGILPQPCKVLHPRRHWIFTDV